MADEDKLILPELGEVVFDYTEEFSKKKIEFTKEPLTNVRLIKLIPREDDRGMLLKDIQSINLPKDENGRPMFGEHYMIVNNLPMIRAFHAHRELWDFFCIVMGKAKFVLIDGRKKVGGKDNPTYGKGNEYILSERNPFVLVVPPGVYHGWKSYVPNTLLSSTGTHLYDPKNLDELRVHYTSFGYNWDTQIK